MRESEREAAALLVAQAMRAHYACDPHPLPETAFVAVWNHVVIGVMALSFREHGPLPIEAMYAFDRAAFPSSFDWAHAVQLGRWVASIPRIGEMLLYASVRHAEMRGLRWGIGEVKPKVRRRFLQMGVKTAELSGTPLLHRVPLGVRPYYCLPPPPVPCLLVLSDAARVLEGNKEAFTARGGILELP